MNKESLRGFKSVFAFTFTQFVKAKSFKIICIVLAVIALAAFPVLTLIQKSSEKELTEVKYNKVHVIGVDEAFINALHKVCHNNEILKDVEFSLSDKSRENLETELEKETKENYVLMDVNLSVPMITVLYGKDTEVDSKQANYLADYLYENSAVLTASVMGLSESQINALNLQTNYYVEYTDKDSLGDEGEGGEVIELHGPMELNEYGVAYGFLMVVLLFIVFSGEAVSMSIITEKSSKVIEYLMISIKPMALILGKVTAMLLAVMTQLAVVGVCLVGSSVINGFIFTKPDGSYGGFQILDGIKQILALEGLNPINVAAAILVVLLGFYGFGMLAGLAGAMVSKIEEAAEGMKLFTFALLIGAYICMIYINVVNGGGDWGAFDNVVYLLPLSSPFIVPSFLLMGRISLSTALIAAALLIVAIVLLIIFVSKVYEYLIYYKGDPVKLKTLIEIAKNSGKKAVRKEADHE